MSGGAGSSADIGRSFLYEGKLCAVTMLFYGACVLHADMVLRGARMRFRKKKVSYERYETVRCVVSTSLSFPRHRRAP